MTKSRKLCHRRGPFKAVGITSLTSKATSTTLLSNKRTTIKAMSHSIDTLTTTTLLRSYQKDFSKVARTKSTIIVLPTGSGKTLIAAAVLQYTVSRHQGALTLFLVPTCLLVEQQAAALRHETRLRVAEYKGGASKPTNFDILVSTPAAFLILSSTPGLNLHVFKHIVFDEVHHIIKRHPYRLIARKLSGLSISPPPLILGLTASLTYAIGELQIQRAIQDICYELNLPTDCIMTASPQQLRSDGYHATVVEANVTIAQDYSMQEDLKGLSVLEIPGKRKSTSLINHLIRISSRCIYTYMRMNT